MSVMNEGSVKVKTGLGKIIRRNMFALLGLLLAVIIATIVAAYILHSADINKLKTMQSDVAHMKLLFTIGRVTVMGLIIYFWPNIFRVVALRANWSEEKLASVIALRWRVALWLMLLELFVGQNILSKVFG